MSEPSPPPQRRASTTGALLSLLVLALAALGGYLLYRASRPHPGIYPEPAAAANTAPQLAPSPPQPLAPSPRPVPERVPELVLPDPEGRPHRLAEWAGRPLLINFWATWCEPCRREIPLLREVRREHAAERLEIVGIAIDHRDDVRKYVVEHGMSYPVLVGEKGGLEAARAFGMDTVLPFSVFADREGRLVALKVGELHADEVSLILGRVREIDQGRLALTQARAEISSGMARLAASRARASTPAQ